MRVKILEETEELPMGINSVFVALRISCYFLVLMRANVRSFKLSQNVSRYPQLELSFQFNRPVQFHFASFFALYNPFFSGTAKKNSAVTDDVVL